MKKQPSEFKVKGKYVKNLFSNLAPKYELMNIIISFGFIYHWRKKLVEVTNPDQDAQILDLCAGNGKVTKDLAKRTPKGKVIGVDFCQEMIIKAKEHLDEDK